jgi:hypothetical protein
MFFYIVLLLNFVCFYGGMCVFMYLDDEDDSADRQDPIKGSNKKAKKLIATKKSTCEIDCFFFG